MSQDAHKEQRVDILPIVIGGDIGAYALARQFHEAFDVLPCVLNTDFIAAITHSRILTTHALPELSAEVILEAVCELASEASQKHVVLIGNTDHVIQLLETIHTQLPQKVVCVLPSQEAFKSVCDKARFSGLCRAHGLATPQTERIKLAGTKPIASTELPFPVVAKPAESAQYSSWMKLGLKKVYYFTEQAQLDELWHKLRDVGFEGDFLVQQLIAGDDTYMDSITIYMGADGHARMLGAAQVLLEDHAPTMLGNPVAMVLRQKPELWNKAEEMLASIGWHGFANFDIKRDPQTGVEYFLDCNPRIGRNSYYNVAGGVNPMRIMVEEALGLGEGEKDVEKRGAGDKDSAGEKSDEVAKKTSTYAKSTSKKSVHIADQEALYTLVPLQLLRRYIRDPQLLSEVNGLIAQKKVANPQHYKADRGSKRMMNVFLTEYNQLRKFAKYYPKPTDSSF